MRSLALSVLAALPLVALVHCGDDGASPGGDSTIDASTDAATSHDATTARDGASTTDGGRADGAQVEPDGASADDATANDATANDGQSATDGASDAAPDAAVDMDRPASCGDTIPLLKLTEIPLTASASLPVTAAFPPGDPSRVIIVQLGGVIRLLKAGALTTFLDLSGAISTDGERGLLGFAFHPGYAQNGRFFVFYTAKTSGDVMIEEYKRSAADPDKADPTPVKTVITQAHPLPRHNGGMLAFGPDGYLYASLGDGFDNTNGQKVTTKLGKILRVDVDTGLAPAGNLTGAGVEPLIWDWGLRNPWRFSFDRKTGALYIGDVGEENYEEIDYEPAASGKKNYGWATMEGMHCQFTPSCDQTGLTLPIIEHPHTEAHSIIGGYVYRGQKIPCLRGRYVYGDYQDLKIWTFTYEGGVLSAKKDLTADLNPTSTITVSPTSFIEDGDGELYFVTLGGNKMYRIDPE